jgi:AcrR family transcriptional regulator
MHRRVDTVNISVLPLSSAVLGYHHGNLREALIDAAEEKARVGGPDEVGLRAVARAAGVSHNAAYRHFADRDELLRAVCERCMSHLAELMEARTAKVARTRNPVDAAWRRLEETGRAYIEFALTEPGWFRTAFRVPLSSEGLDRASGRGPGGLSPFELLGRALDGLVEVGAMAADDRPGAEFPAWASVHGLASLLLDGPLRDLPDQGRRFAEDKVLSVVSAGLRSG